MARMSMNVYAKAKAIELSTYTPPKSNNDKFKSREQVRQRA